MALQSLTGGLWVPTPANGFAFDETLYVIDATTERVALIVRCPKAGVIDRFDAHVGVVTNSPDNGLRFSIQGVSLVTGLPDGTILGATSNAFVTYAHTVTTGWKATDFGETVTVTRGQLIALVIDIPTFAAADSICMRAIQSVHQSLFPHGVSVTVTKQGQYIPWFALHYTDGYALISPTLPAPSEITSVTFNSGTAGADEYALAFSLPFPCKLNAATIFMMADAAADFEVLLYGSDGATVLSTLTHDGDVTSGAVLKNAFFYLGTEVTLLANTTYRLAVRPTTVNSVYLAYHSYSNLALMETKGGGGAFYLSARLNQGGSWTDYNSGTFRSPHISLNFSAFDDAVSAGGGSGQGPTIYIGKEDKAVQKSNPSKTVDVTLAAADTGKADVVAVKSANHQLFIQKITYNPVTVAAQAVTFQDDAGTPVKIGVIPASQATPLTLDFGPKGVALTAGKNLDISNTAGPAAQIHIEAYEKIVSGSISTGTAAASQ